MTDLKKLENAVDLAQTRLEFHLSGIRHANAHPIVDHMSKLIDARIALANAVKPDDNQVRKALEGLVEACGGEVEEVFAGEIGTALGRARAALGHNTEQEQP